jgi:hypothetical protein
MRHAPALLDKEVAPRIIPKEERQPLAPQYRNYHSHSEGNGGSYHSDSDSGSSRGSLTPTPAPAKPEIIFNEFRKPISQADAPATSANNDIDAALNNPDYFNPDSQNDDSSFSDSGVRVEQSKASPPTPALDDFGDDLDYFNNNDEVIETRSNLEEESDKLDNDPLNPSTTTTTTTAAPVTSASTQTTTTTTATEKSTKENNSIGERSLKGIPFQAQSTNNREKAAGFVVNRRPENILEQNRNDESVSTSTKLFKNYFKQEDNLWLYRM